MVFTLIFLTTIISSFFVVTFRNPIHSVLSLIVVFASITVLFISIEAEFLALMILVIYIGAISVLFLFVVMMIEFDYSLALRTKYYYLTFLAQLILFYAAYNFMQATSNFFFIFHKTAFPLFSYFYIYSDYSLLFSSVSDLLLLAQILYIHSPFELFVASLILLIAMIGSITITLLHSKEAKRQFIFEQLESDYKASIRRFVQTKKGESIT